MLKARVGVAAACGLVFVSNEASAAALGSLATSIGLFATLVTLILSKAAPGNSALGDWPTVLGALSAAAGVVWIWRLRVTPRLSAHLAKDVPAVTLLSQSGPTVALPSTLARAQLLQEMRLLFVTVQSAWDLGETENLAKLTTPDMLREFLGEGEDGEPLPPQQATEVVVLRADLLGFEDLTSALVVTVEFSGLMRDGPERGADPFRELWMLTKAKHGAESWRLARHQALL